MQINEAKINLILWDMAHAEPDQVRIFGVKGDSLYLVKKSASLLERIFAVFLRMIGSIRTDEKSINDLYAKSTLKLSKEDKELLGQLEDLQGKIAEVVGKKIKEIVHLETELNSWSEEGIKIQSLITRQDEQIAQLKVALKEKEEEIDELSQIPVEVQQGTPSPRDSQVKEEKIKILEQRLARVKDPSQADFLKNMVDAFKNSEDTFIELLEKPVYLQDENLPFIEHILKSLKRD